MLKQGGFSLILCMLVASTIAIAQDQKQEVEKKIKPDQMPEAALSVLEPYLNVANNIKYYKETDINHESYECKFKLDGDQFSVEFDLQGEIEDIEVLVDIDKLERVAHDKILEHLQQYLKVRFRRVQLQFSADNDTDEQLLTRVIKNQNWDTPYYEIVIAVKDQEGWYTYEMLFDSTGKFVSQKLVVERQTDNILY